MSDSFVPTVATIATIGIAVSIVAMFLSRVAAVRKQAWVAARPKLEPATADRMPPGFGDTLACVALPLAELGFVAAENVQGPRFSIFGHWSQALFPNGEYYRPSWRKAARLAMTKRVFARPPGFDVAPRR